MKSIEELKKERLYIEKQLKRCLDSLGSHVPLSLGYRENRSLLKYYESRLINIRYDIELQRNKMIENGYRNAE
mgnify:CR=1 FL=1